MLRNFSPEALMRDVAEVKEKLESLAPADNASVDALTDRLFTLELTVNDIKRQVDILTNAGGIGAMQETGKALSPEDVANGPSKPAIGETLPANAVGIFSGTVTAKD